MPKKKHAADVANSAAAKAEAHAWRFRRGAVGRQSAVAGRSCGEGAAGMAALALRIEHPDPVAIHKRAGGRGDDALLRRHRAAGQRDDITAICFRVSAQ